jgi:hydrophobic/amphiphilic exporter-1 (mainly G- bacteria), HAE1 family
MSLTKASIHRPVTVSMFVVAVVLFGLVSLDRLALNLLPDISYPSITIQTDYEDAAPEEVESLLTRPVEEAVGVIPGLRRLSSTSRSGQSEVVLEFSWDANMDLASLEVREKLDVVELPRDVKRPVMLRFDPSYDPIMRLQLYGDMGLARLRYAAEKELKKNLESTEGVAAIKIIGGLEEQIRIEIDEGRLAELGIPITEVAQVLTSENLNQASGSLYDLDANYLVRVLNQFRTVDEIKEIVIRDTDGRKIVLGEIARVWRGAKDREIIARLNGNESVEMAIYKEGDANTVTVARAVSRRLDSLNGSKLWPDGVEYQVVFNQADFIESAVEDVQTAAMLGGLLAVIVLFLFLRDLRSTITIAISIPVSIMATFALMYQTGISLNLMSLGGVALGIGMLVDNSIVVLESVHRHKQEGARLAHAVYAGTKEVGMAVTASTLTTVAVFLPLIFVEGIAGQLFQDQALTITYALVASLLVALNVIPMILALRMKKAVEQDTGEVEAAPATGVQAKIQRVIRFLLTDIVTVLVADLRKAIGFIGRMLGIALEPVLNLFDRAFGALEKIYPRSLRWALEHKGSVFGLALIAAVSAGVLAMTIGAELIPPMTQGEFSFEVRLAEASPLERTDRLLSELERQVAGYPEVATVFTSAGGSNQNQFARNMNEEHVGQLYVVMKDRQDKESEARTIDKIRGQLAGYTDITYQFSRPTLFSFKTPVEVEVYGYDLESLRIAADMVAERLDTIDGLSDITTTTKLGNPEVQIRFDRLRLARLGLEESQVANVLRNKIRGEVASRFREEDKQIEILVRADESDRATIDDIKNLVVNMSSTPAGNGGPDQGQQNQQAGDGAQQNQTAQARRVVPIRLAAIADIEIARGPSQIRRIRSQRAAVISANLTGRDLNSVSEEIQAEIQRVQADAPGTVTIALGGQNEELRSSYQSLLLALGLAVFLVYLVMASQFESLVHPFIILFSVPLGLIGVVIALFVTGTTFSVMVFLGVIILAGIVVNNAIVLIDYTRQMREMGMPTREALQRAGEVRLRPILMTTLTTVLGLVPMALGWGEGAEIRTPMAITVIGGLSFSTLLTLLFIPVVYELIDGQRQIATSGAVELPDGPLGAPGVGD